MIRVAEVIFSVYLLFGFTGLYLGYKTKDRLVKIFSAGIILYFLFAFILLWTGVLN